MPAETESDASTGIYRCNDISSLKFRVHVRTVEASGLEEDVESDKHEEQVFLWQERVFSPREIQFYSDFNNCSTPLHNYYHKQIKDTDRNAGNSKNILFSYLLPDIVSQKLERDILLFQNNVLPNQKENKTSIETSQMPHASDFGSDNHSMEKAKSRYEFMYIMADVGYLSEGKANEHILVVMKWDSSLKVLSIFPDFNINTSVPGYLLEGFSDACNQYVFWIVPESSHFERKKLQDDKSTEQTNAFLPSDVLIPRHGVMNIHVFGEIKGARYFDLENLFLRYHLELPNGWSCETASDSTGITQQAKILNGFANLNHLFEMTLSYNLPSTEDTKTPTSEFCEVFPKLFFDVVGLDGWGRVGREGCSWVRVPPISGQHNFRLQCWRPMKNLSMSCTNMLKRYFIGGTPHLANMSFNGIPDSFQGARLSKFGVKEIATGELDISLNIILHSQTSTHLSEDMAHTTFLDRFPALSLLQSVNIALKAFLWARKRMQTAISIE